MDDIIYILSSFKFSKYLVCIFVGEVFDRQTIMFLNISALLPTNNKSQIYKIETIFLNTISV